MYHIDIKHDGLKKSRRLSGADRYVLQQRARLQADAWEARWRRLSLDQRGEESLHHLPSFEAQLAHAAKLTADAQQAVAAWSNILQAGLEAAPFKMEMLYDSRMFPERRPVASVEQRAPDPPDKSDPSFNFVQQFEVWAEFWALFLPKLKLKRDTAAQAARDAAQSRYDAALKSWQDSKHELSRANAKAKVMFDMDLDAWWARALAYQKQQQDENAQVDRFRQRYANKEPDAVLEYLDAVLSNAEYPELFPMRWQTGFVAETGVLTVDYELPPPEVLPSLKSVKYDVMNDTFEQSYWSAAEIADFYESAIYQTCLRTLHDVFAADAAGAIASVAFNGWADFTDKLHGRPARACILSVQAGKAAVQQASALVSDPQAGFRSLKGVAGAKLADMTAVEPLSRLDRPGEQPAETGERKEALT